MAQIVTPVAGDNRLLLSNEEILRKMTFGAAWTKVRVGIRFCFEAAGDINNAGLIVGVCQGDTNGFKNASTTDFIGAHFGATLQNSTLAFQTGPPAYVQMAGVSTLALKRQGNTNTTVAGSNATSYGGAAPLLVHTMFLVDIQKSNPNYTITPWLANSIANAQADAPIGALMVAMESDDTPPNVGSFGTILMPYTGSALFDTVDIVWNKANQPLEIADIICTRLY
jgi:hypothetical protein